MIGDLIDTSWADAEIFVFDTTARTPRRRSRSRKASVVCVSWQGRGIVVRAMLKLVEADDYDTLKTDATQRITDLIKPVLDDTSDLVVGARLGSPEAGAFRRLDALTS